MNQKTSKLLSRYAQETGKNYKELKNNWNLANRIERTRLRNEMKTLLKRAAKDDG